MGRVLDCRLCRVPLRWFVAFLVVIVLTLLSELYFSVRDHLGYMEEPFLEEREPIYCTGYEHTNLEIALRFNIHILLCAILTFWMLYLSRKEVHTNSIINRVSVHRIDHVNPKP